MTIAKQLVLILFIILTTPFLAQEPGANQDFGKYTKQIEYDTNFFESGGYQLELVNPLRKLPKDKNWTLFEEGTQNFKSLPNITIHKSRTFLGDTTSVSVNGEYIEHQPNPYSSSVKPISYYSDFVTNKEWNVFRAYVRDSIGRRILANNFGQTGWLKTHEDKNCMSPKSESEWNLDWQNQKLDFDKKVDNYMFPFLSELTYGESDNFYHYILVDERKLTYQYHWENYQKCLIELDTIKWKWSSDDCQIKENVALFRDSTFWIKDTSLNHFNNVEDGLCQFYNYHPYFENKPVTSVNSPQARGYLHWLETNHQKRLDLVGAPFKVIYELPQVLHSSTYKMDVESSSFDLVNWKISNSDYEVFVEYVKDSIARRIIADQYPLQYSVPVLDDQLKDKYYSEWDLNWSSKIDWENKTATPFKLDKKKVFPKYGLLNNLFYSFPESDTILIDKRKLMLEQYYFDFKTAGINVEREISNHHNYGGYICETKQVLSKGKQGLKCIRGFGESDFIGKSLSLSVVNYSGNSTDVHANYYRSRFIIRDIINIYPNINHKECVDIYTRNGICQVGNFDDSETCQFFNCNLCPQNLNWDSIPKEYDFKTNPNALIQDITYLQFLAYWRWRIQKRTLPNNNVNPVISHYIPSREEFEQIQAGKEIFHPMEVHELPTPAFRYVVKFYPKEIK